MMLLMLASAPKATECGCVHTHTHGRTLAPKQMSHKRVCHTQGDTHKYILQQQRFQQESCQLSEILEGTDHHLSPYLLLMRQESLSVQLETPPYKLSSKP